MNKLLVILALSLFSFVTFAGTFDEYEKQADSLRMKCGKGNGYGKGDFPVTWDGSKLSINGESVPFEKHESKNLFQADIPTGIKGKTLSYFIDFDKKILSVPAFNNQFNCKKLR